jgi:hypothetical protein
VKKLEDLKFAEEQLQKHGGKDYKIKRIKGGWAIFIERPEGMEALDGESEEESV